MVKEIKQFANIKVIGIGGGGNNAVNRMVKMGLDGLEFWAMNTDAQALHCSLAENILQIGDTLTNGLGAGSDPEVGEKAAVESSDDLKVSIDGSDMIFITAGMGGGTGTGAGPVVAKLAKESGALTIGVVTKPFRFEGPVRMRQAEQGIERLREEVDALIVIPNDKLLQVVEQTTALKDAFAIADDVLLQGVKGISNLISKNGLINLDFSDVKMIMKDAGSAMMGIGRSSGNQRAIEAAEAAISSPLLEESITGATGIILNIAGNESLGMHEVNDAAQVIYDAVDPNANIIWGAAIDEDLKEDVVITVIATGFKPQRVRRDRPMSIPTARKPEVKEPDPLVQDGFDPILRSTLKSKNSRIEDVEDITEARDIDPSDEVEEEIVETSTSIVEEPVVEEGLGEDEMDAEETDIEIPTFLRRMKNAKAFSSRSNL